MGGSIIDELVKSIQQDPGQSNKSVSAVVSRTDDDGVVWVRLAGSDQDTPTESISAEVKPGDAVTVEWRNKRLYIAGNYSNPAAGVERVQIAEENVSAATKVINTVKKAVDTVAKIAGNTAQYFWHMETGTDTGVHITEIPKDDFLADPANGGGNLLARSNGIAVRDGLTELSRFGADGVQIGQDGQTRSVIGDRSMQLMDRGDNVYFLVGDKRVDGVYTFTAEHPYIVTNIREHQLMVSYPINTNYTVTVLDENDNVIPYDRLSGSFAIISDSYTFSEDGLYKVLYTTSNPVYSFCYLQNNNFVGCNAVSFADDGKASGNYSFVEGHNTTASRFCCHAEGSSTTASKYCSHAEGSYTTASGYISHAEGSYTTASGDYSHAEGYKTTVSYGYGHAEGYKTTASGYGSHAEGASTTASESTSHAEGHTTIASGACSHAEGSDTIASEYCSHAEGRETVASGYISHASGDHTYATEQSQTVIGKYNVVTTSTDSNENTVYNAGNYAFIIGNGTSDSNRSNAFTVDWNGRATTYNPNITVGTAPSSTNSNIALCLADKSDNRIGDISYYYSDTDVSGIIMNAYRKVNDENKYNALRLSLDSSGNPTVAVSSASAWRSALGLSNILDMVRVVEFKKTNVSIGANTSLSPVEISATAPTGFSFVAIVGWRIDTTDTTSGTNSASCVVTNYWGTTTLNATVRNFASSAAKVTVNLRVLYRRTTL